MNNSINTKESVSAVEINRIMQMIPHRYPMLMVDKVIDMVPDKSAIGIKNISIEKEVNFGTKVNHIMRHTVGLYHGQIGSKNWKRYLSDNMMARDSDFQKAKHIMAIVQNNEKINPTIA